MKQTIHDTAASSDALSLHFSLHCPRTLKTLRQQGRGYARPSHARIRKINVHVLKIELLMCKITKHHNLFYCSEVLRKS